MIRGGGDAPKTISPCSPCRKKLNAETTEGLSDLCVQMERITPLSVILSEAKNPGIFSRWLSFQMRGFFASLRMTDGGLFLYE